MTSIMVALLTVLTMVAIREGHNKFRDLQHGLAGLIDERDEAGYLFTKRQESNAQKQREHNDLKHICIVHGYHNVIREPGNDVVNEIISRFLYLYAGIQKFRGAGARLGNESGHNAHSGGKAGGRHDPEHKPKAHRGELLDIAHFADSAGNAEEDQRDDQHFQHPQEHVPDRGEKFRCRWREKADGEADDDTDQNLCAEGELF